jgi:hypothetical protein
VGFNLLYWIDDQGHFESGRLVDQINGIHPALLRYPAGTASQNYDWRSNSVINPRLFPFNPTNELLSTDSFIEILRQTGAGGVVVVDITSVHLKNRLKGVNRGQPGYMAAQPVSTAEDQAMVDKAVEWAKRFHSHGVSPIYELGNEHYLAFLDYMVFTPEMYVEKCKRFITGIRAVDPDAKFAVCGPDPFNRSHYYYQNTPWWPVVLKELAGDIDRIVLHKYWDPSEINNDPGAAYGQFRRDLITWGQKEHIQVDHIKIGFTEWGGRNRMDAKTFGIFCFRALCSFAENGVDYAIEWPFRWTDNGEFGGTQLIGRPDEKERFAYSVMAAWSRYFPGKRIVDLKLKTPASVTSFAAVDDAGRIVLALVNNGEQAVMVDVPPEFTPCLTVSSEGPLALPVNVGLSACSVTIFQSN